jgi:hypothetical protein
VVFPIKHWWNETCQFCRVVNQLLSGALRVLILALSLYGGYLVTVWWQDTEAVVEYGIGEVSRSTARPNDVLIFYQPLRKTRNCWGMVRRVLFGQCGFFLVSEAPAWIVAPWEGRLTYAVQVPPEAIPGECGFQIITRFVCTPLDWIEPRIATSTPITFRVLRYDQ